VTTTFYKQNAGSDNAIYNNSKQCVQNQTKLGIVHPKMTILSLFNHQTRKTFVHLQNTNEDLFDEI